MKTISDSNTSTLRSFGCTEKLAMSSTLLALSQLAVYAAPAPDDEKKPSEDDSTALPQMVVQADGTKTLYKPENLSSQKYTAPLRDIPQTVTVIPEEVMKEQGASSLRDVLRNVPGISIQAGEGGQPPGDNLSIRGFSARSDLFVDGVRDFGGYSRDTFNTEQVEVVKGPSSTNAGRGSTGGTVNLSSKMPHLKNAYEIMLGGGTDQFGRTTVDLNQEIPGLKGTAVRINGVYNTMDVPDRDNVSQERWGVAPSITFGLDTDTRFTLSYFHMEEDNTPDYGLPWVPRSYILPTGAQNNITGLHSGRPPVDDSNWYGLSSRDHNETQTDILTAIFEKDFNDDLKLTNITRYGRNTIDLIATPPRFFTDPAFRAPNRLPIGVDPTSVRRTDVKYRDEVDSIISNQTDVRYDFLTGKIKHEMVGSLEFASEKSKNKLRDDRNKLNMPYTDMENPDSSTPYNPDIFYTGFVNSVSADTFAASLFDTAHLTEQWLLSGGARWESIHSDFGGPSTVTPGASFSDSTANDLFSYRAALTYKPMQKGSIYLSYGTSFNPSVEGFTPSDSPASASYYDVDPEENTTIELGTKWELLDEKLLLSAALFRTDKTNARTVDPTDPTDVISLAGEQRVQGFELGFTGLITEQWRIIGGYTYLDSEVTSSNNALEEGNEIANTPSNSFSLWTVHDLPKGFQIGVGAQYIGSRYNNANEQTRQEAPSFTIFNAMVGYQLNENVSFRLNGYNLGDKDYIDQLGGGHYVPGQGRSISLTADIKF
ncbi:MAG: TonB-dependent siderophore receptor [Luteolibacter sp.]